MLRLVAHLVALVLAVLPAVAEGAEGPRPFRITVVDDGTGRGVPMVELRTVHDVLFVTDSNGVVAFDEPGLMGQDVFFHVRSHGYEFPKDGFGYRGKALKVVPGGGARLEIHRQNVAERLYRVTGAGIYRDSVLVGAEVPLRRPVLDAQVLGQDSVLNAIYQGQLRWFWGDTSRPGYPLGNFHVPGASSRLPQDGGLDPARGVDLVYFEDERGFARPTAQLPGPGPTWLGGLVVLRDDAGRERMFASYSKIRNMLETYERGLVEWDDEEKTFEKIAEIPMDAPIFPNGHPFLKDEGGVSWIYFATPYPLTRVRATAEDLARPESYEAFTPLEPGSRLDHPRLDRDADGRLRYAWKANTPAVGPQEQARLIKEGKITPGEALLHLQDVETGAAVLAHGGSVYWNEYRRRWVMIAVQVMGTSFLGEVWYAEADAPLGPWVYARKVATHDRYSFYNPKQHPYFDQDGGRTIYFEGTYTHTFSGNDVATPRYDYNQMMYRLDLADPRLNLPVPIARREDGSYAPGPSADAPAFFAPDRPGPGLIPVYQDGSRLTTDAGRGDRPPAFFALPADAEDVPATTSLLCELNQKDASGRRYAIKSDQSHREEGRTKTPLCRVWRAPGS